MLTDNNTHGVMKIGEGKNPSVPTIELGDTVELREDETGIGVRVVAIDGDNYRGCVVRCYALKLDGKAHFVWLRRRSLWGRRCAEARW